MDSSSSITPHSFKYDVFLGFKGEDTQFSFTSHLCGALREKQIEVYLDEKLQIGEEFSSIKDRIAGSRISVIIFSENYAVSRRCLEELVHILECRKLYKQIVIPVFYHIDPSDVMRQKGCFADAFMMHEKRYNDSSVIIRWREALTEAANLSGFYSRDFKTESELKLAIVEVIVNRLNDMARSSSENTHTVDIREEDSGHEDEEAIQVPKITVERMFVASNLILEIPSAVFDQLSSVHKPQYILLSMLMSLATMLICIIELVYKGRQERVGWRWGKKKRIPWFYYPSPRHDKPFGTVTDFTGLLSSFFQCIFSVSYYVFYLQNIDDPIKITSLPLVFAFCLTWSTFSKKSPRGTPKKDALL